MSFIDTIGNVAKSVGGFLSSNSIGSNLAKTALYGYALNRLTKSIQKQSDIDDQPDPGRQIVLTPDTNNSVPVVYGDTYVSGIVTDAWMATNNKAMWVCLTLSEMTGDLINGNPSEITFKEVYRDGLRLDFERDGNTVDVAYDDAGNNTDTLKGYIKVYPFVNGSTNPTRFYTEPAGSSLPAYTLFPSWSPSDAMNGLVFALVYIQYRPKNEITGIGEWKFRLNNTMSEPGDVLNDYMTNTRYGAGIPEAEINVS
tara:strand:+ start:87 stop:851 length:765 start_codon:yes stop_codon:yes gene_type:complete